LVFNVLHVGRIVGRCTWRMQQPKRVMTRYPLWLLVSVQPVYFRETPWSRDLVLQTPGARAPRGMLAAADAMFTEDWEPHFLLREFSASIFKDYCSLPCAPQARQSRRCTHRSHRPSARAKLATRNVAAFGTCGLNVVDPGMAVRSRKGARPCHAREVYLGNGRTAKPATILLFCS